MDIPADWRPSVEGEQFAADRGFTPAEIADVAFKFRNHFSGKGERRRDWSKAWLNWVLEERRPLCAIQGGKADPLWEARRFTEAEWREKYALFVRVVASNPSYPWPKKWGPGLGTPGCLMPEPLQRELLAAHSIPPNRGSEKCTAQAQ